MKGKLGPAAAITATAHKIAIIFYTMVKNQVEYDNSLWANRDAMRERRNEAKFHKEALRRGYTPPPPTKTNTAAQVIANRSVV